MSQVDYEAAWHELAATVDARPSGWGTRNLLAEMARLQAKHRVSENLLDRVVRLYGVGALMSRLINREVDASGPGGTPPSADRADASDIEGLGGRDEHHTDRAAVPVHA